MWSILNGTLVNTAAVLLGSGTGLLLSGRLPDRYQRIILDVLGLVTITLGIDAAVIVFGDTVRQFRPTGAAGLTYGARLGMVMIASLVIGALFGTALRLHERLEGLGEVIHRRFGGAGSGTKFAEGFLTASVVFCVGPLTLLGCLRNGAEGDPSLLYIKSVLDAFSSMALAAALGAGVVASVLTVLIFQGGLALLAAWASGGIDPLSMGMMNAVGGVMLLATALLLLEIKRIPVAAMLPALFLPPVLIRLAEWASPGILAMPR